MLELAQDVERCQRNWKYTDIPQEHIDEIVNVCTTMPTKNNLAYYNLYVSTDLEFNNAVYNISINPSDNGTIDRNSQVNAPLLLIWTSNKSVTDPLFQQVNYPRIIDRDIAMSVGISSGAAGLAAANLGYKTGFCKCFVHESLIKLMFDKFNKIDDPVLMLGIGMPNLNYKRTEVVKNNIIVKDVHSCNKNIEVSQI
jgi:nitroreductase